MRRVWMAVSLLVIAVLLTGCFGGNSSPKVGGGLGGGSGGGPSLREEEARIAELSERLLRAYKEDDTSEIESYLDGDIHVHVTFEGLIGRLFIEVMSDTEESDRRIIVVRDDKAIWEWDYDGNEEPYETFDALGVLDGIVDEQLEEDGPPFIDGRERIYSQKYRGYASLLRPLGPPVLIQATLSLSWEKTESQWRLRGITWLIEDDLGDLRRDFDSQDAERMVERKMRQLATVRSPHDLRAYKQYFYDWIEINHIRSGELIMAKEARFEEFLDPNSAEYKLLIEGLDHWGESDEIEFIPSAVAGFVLVYQYFNGDNDDSKYIDYEYRWIFVEQYGDFRLVSITRYD